MERCIENGIRVFLERKNPGFLSAADTGPHRQRFFMRNVAELLIPYNPPQKTDIGCPDAVVIVQIQTGEIGHKNPVDFLVGNPF